MKVTIRYEVETGREGRTVVKEKTFTSEEAMQKWTEKQEQTNPRWAGVQAYSYED